MTYLFLFTYRGNLWNCNISSVITGGPRPNWQYLDQFWREIWVSHLAAFTGPGPLISVVQCLHPSIPPSTLRPPCCHPWLCRGTPNEPCEHFSSQIIENFHCLSASASHGSFWFSGNNIYHEYIHIGMLQISGTFSPENFNRRWLGDHMSEILIVSRHHPYTWHNMSRYVTTGARTWRSRGVWRCPGCIRPALDSQVKRRRGFIDRKNIFMII